MGGVAAVVVTFVLVLAAVLVLTHIIGIILVTNSKINSIRDDSQLLRPAKVNQKMTSNKNNQQQTTAK